MNIFIFSPTVKMVVNYAEADRMEKLNLKADFQHFLLVQIFWNFSSHIAISLWIHYLRTEHKNFKTYFTY